MAPKTITAGLAKLLSVSVDSVNATAPDVTTSIELSTVDTDLANSAVRDWVSTALGDLDRADDWATASTPPHFKPQTMPCAQVDYALAVHASRPLPHNWRRASLQPASRVCGRMRSS